MVDVAWIIIHIQSKHCPLNVKFEKGVGIVVTLKMGDCGGLSFSSVAFI